MKKNNELSYYTQQTLFNLALLFINGTIIQTFMLELGITPDLVSIFSSVSQIVQLLSMLLVSKKIEKSKNMIAINATSQLFCLLVIIVCLGLCFFNKFSVSEKFYWILSAGIATNIGLGIHNVVTYKAIYHIIDMNRYGFVTGVSGICIGAMGILASAVFSCFIKNFAFNTVMISGFSLGLSLVLASFLLSIKFKDNGFKSETVDTKKINIFKYKPFRVLFLPNLLRGFNAGFFSVIVAVGYDLKVLNSVMSSYLLIITNISLLLGCFLYSIIAKKKIDKHIILFSSIGLFLIMPFFGITKNPYGFLLLYGFGYIILNFVNYAVPVLVTRIVDYNIMGQYTSWRMILHTLGISTAGFVALPMINHLGAVTTFIIAGACQLVSGITYFIYSKDA